MGIDGNFIFCAIPICPICPICLTSPILGALNSQLKKPFRFSIIIHLAYIQI